MGNYRFYTAVMKIVFGLVCLLFLLAFLNEDFSQLMFVALIMMPLGIFQLAVGFHFITTLERRSEVVRAGVRVYWFLTLGYFLGLYIASRFKEIHEDFYWVYLLVVPWFIVAYQCFVVQKSYKERTNSQIKSTLS